MDRKSLFIAESFDLGKLKKTCNVRGCDKIPTREVTIFERDIITSEKRELVSLYFCTEHYGNINKLMRDLNKVSEPRKKTGRRVKDISCVTY